jgi:hypothetical protein
MHGVDRRLRGYCAVAGNLRRPNASVRAEHTAQENVRLLQRSPRTHRRPRGVPMPYQPSTLGPPFARAAFPARNAAQRASAPQRCACGRWPHDPPPVGSHGADRSGATAESMMSSRAVAEAAVVTCRPSAAPGRRALRARCRREPRERRRVHGETPLGPIGVDCQVVPYRRFFAVIGQQSVYSPFDKLRHRASLNWLWPHFFVKYIR